MRSLRGWRELTIVDESAKEPGQVAKISTLRFAAIVFAISGCFTLYIWHVYKTQDILDELQVLRRENVRLHLQHNQLIGEFNAATGPSVIYRRAADLDLEEGHTYATTIQIPVEVESP